MDLNMILVYKKHHDLIIKTLQMTGIGVLLALILLICVSIILFLQDFASFTFDFNSYVRKKVTFEKAVRSYQESGREIQQLPYTRGQEKYRKDTYRT